MVRFSRQRWSDYETGSLGKTRQHPLEESNSDRKRMLWLRIGIGRADRYQSTGWNCFQEPHSSKTNRNASAQTCRNVLRIDQRDRSGEHWSRCVSERKTTTIKKV